MPIISLQLYLNQYRGLRARGCGTPVPPDVFELDKYDPIKFWKLRANKLPPTVLQSVQKPLGQTSTSRGTLGRYIHGLLYTEDTEGIRYKEIHGIYDPIKIWK